MVVSILLKDISFFLLIFYLKILISVSAFNLLINKINILLD
ncbi:hypothetical protein HMPREF3200_00195 [Anaerococcus tetradius]|uniref:Uncharacterized protein n=1 Tax=Anaerococcus tetradius TaxID=33036 RepID=A0A133KHX6_9FIRM|nr:hypothetical protein HMPREF3200_00195 [Anaerococcus tetradius]